jgi:hypothetical protein
MAAKQIVASKQIPVVLLFARFFIIVPYFFCNRNILGIAFIPAILHL